MIKTESELEDNAVSFQKGFLAIKSVINKLLNGKPDESLEKIELKLKVLNYIKKNKEAYLSELIEKFKVDPSLMIEILEELKSQKKIRRTE